MLKQMHLDQCDSTQDELERHLEGLDPSENLLVSTNKQLKGRGRGAHTWDHLPGALAFSFSAHPHPSLTWQSLEVAVCLAHFLQQELGVSVGLKWPNDLYAGEKKCGGILLKHRGATMIIGVGMNILPGAQWGHLLANEDRLQRDWQRDLPAKFVRSYLQRHPLTIEEIRSTWIKDCVHLNRHVVIVDGDQLTQGVFLGPGPHGEAVVQTKSGNVSVFNGTLRWN